MQTIWASLLFSAGFLFLRSCQRAMENKLNALFISMQTCTVERQWIPQFAYRIQGVFIPAAPHKTAIFTGS
jgi:hypothetical protein